MRATIKMIAERAGVSIGTVDRVLHDRPYVKAEVRERVLQVLEELDYHPNRMASALATSGTPRHLALVQPEWEKGYVQDEMEAGVTRFLEEYRDYNVTLDVRTYAREDEAACRRLQNGRLARRLNAAKGLLLLDAVLEAVLGLQGFHLILGVLNEGRLIHAVAVVGLLVVLQNLGQLAPGFVLCGLCHLLGELDDVLAMFGNACFHGNFSFYWFNRCAVQTVPGPPSSRPNTRRALAAVRVSSSSSGTSSSRASTAAVWAISPESFRLPRKGTGAI